MVTGDALSTAMGVLAGSSLSVQIIHDRREVRLVPIGEIDVHSATTFLVAGELAIDERPDHVHIDLSQVTFMDSSGAKGIQSVIDAAEAIGVPCTIVGRDVDLVGNDPVSRPIVVWSGSTTRLVALPKN